MKRLSLFLVLALALSAMLIACAKKDDSGSEKGCTQDWANVFKGTAENPAIFEITTMHSVAYSADGNKPIGFVASGSKACGNLSKDVKDAVEKIGATLSGQTDCVSSEGKVEETSSAHAVFSPNGYSVVAAYLDENNKLNVRTRLQMGEDGETKSRALAVSSDDKYQWTDWKAIDLSDNVTAGTCEYHLQAINVTPKGYNVSDMNPTTGELVGGGKTFAGSQIDFYYDFGTNMMRIETTLKGKEAPGRIIVNPFTVIKATKSTASTSKDINNKMYVEVK